MSAKDLGFALLVILVWGLNFVVIRVGLDDLPPMLLGAMRFTLAAIPAVFFIRRPKIPLRWLLACYSLPWCLASKCACTTWSVCVLPRVGYY